MVSKLVRRRRDGRGALDADGSGLGYASSVITGVPNGVLLPNSAGTVVTTPDLAAWDVTGVLRLVVRASSPIWNPGGFVLTLVGHWLSPANQSWGLFTGLGGGAAVFISADGAATVVSTFANPGFVPNTTYWLGAEYNTATGQRDLYIADGSSAAVPAFWSGWTQFSSAVLAAAVPFASAAPVSLGGTGDASFRFLAGVIYRAQIYDDGVLIANPDFSSTGNPLAVPGAPNYTDSLGLVWTLAGAAVIRG